MGGRFLFPRKLELQTVKVKTETRVAYLKGNRQSCLLFIIPGTQTPESTPGRPGLMH